MLLARECYGDAILMTPLIKSLRHEFPEASIYVIAFTRIIYEFFSADCNITAVYHAKRNLHQNLFKLFPKKFDILFNPKNHRSKSFFFLSLLVRAKYKVGLRNTNHENIYDCLIDLPPGTHESLRNLSLLEALGKQLPKSYRPYVPEMPLSEEIHAFIETLKESKFIGINISAGTPGGHRTVEQWLDLINNFPDERFVIFSAPSDLEEKRAIERSHVNILHSPSTRNLHEVWKSVENLKLLVTPDTSLVHIASCSDTPLVALYRNSQRDNIEYSPLSTLQEVLVSATPEIITIENEAVTSAVKRMLENTGMNAVAVR